ncbi:MAG TPA: hypothetical protein PLZ40_07490 [Ferruginibacter sp.]|jgi:hypothetical protein|nr:hypothetical protein [Ferruginibacter sp.]
MEKKFYNEDFEQFLRESVESFQMFPSRKVWYGIYNDLHPSKKWPSLAITLLLVSAVLFLGISNNNSINRDTQKKSATLLRPQHKNTKDHNSSPLIAAINNQKNIFYISQNPITENRVTIKDQLPQQQQGNVFATSGNATATLLVEIPQQLETGAILAPMAERNTQTIVLLKETGATTNTRAQSAETAEEDNEIIGNNFVSANIETQQTSLANLPLQQNVKKPLAEKTYALQKEEDRKWVENYAFYNKPAQKRWKSRSLLSFYITPSVGFRTFEAKSNLQPSNSSITVNNNSFNRDIKDYISQASAVNLEVGSMLLYSLSKNIRIKAGLQFNFSNYLSFAEQLSHTTQTTLLLKTDNGQIDEVPVTTMYKNNYSNPYALSRINNKSLQLSVPIGAEYKVAGNKKLKWYTGATIQPTLITGGNAYAISADKRYYAEYSSLLRKLNVNTAVETYLSYTTANGASVIVGPQVRYQLFSSYINRYLYSEKRYNVGIKIGFTTNF